MKTFSASQRGFTLLELMVALALGLLLTAAALQLMLGAQQSYRFQQGGGQVQDNAIFGLETLNRSIRLANLGSGGIVHDAVPWGGIVMTTDVPDLTVTSSSVSSTFDVPTNLEAVSVGGSPVPEMYVSRGQGMTTSSDPKGWQGRTAVTGTSDKGGTVTVSDQLTVQYRAPMDGADCEGRAMEGPTRGPVAFKDREGKEFNQVSDGDMVVERYYLERRNLNDENSPLELFFDAARYRLRDFQQIAKNTVPFINGSVLGEGAVPVMQNVEHFHVLLNVLHDQFPIGLTDPRRNQVETMTIGQYMAMPSATAALPNQRRPRIIGVQYAVLTRSEANSSIDNGSGNYTMLDQQVTPANTTDKVIRKVYVSNTMLRNGRGSAV